MAILSEEFQKELIDVVKCEVKEAVKVVERQALQPIYVRRSDVPKLYAGRLSLNTVDKWVSLGLKRYEPVDGGGVFFKIKQLEAFMESCAY